MPDRLALIITGTRQKLTKADRDTIRAALTAFVAEHGRPKVVIHGDCKTGVDAFVNSRFQAPMLRVPADWIKWREAENVEAAGPVRNTAVVTIGKCLRDGSTYEVHWLAFPMGKSTGTRDCARKCEQAGFAGRVVELGEVSGA